jgi:hypothetical protein
MQTMQYCFRTTLHLCTNTMFLVWFGGGKMKHKLELRKIAKLKNYDEFAEFVETEYPRIASIKTQI